MRSVVFGGNWNNSANAGVFTRNFNNYRSNDNNNYGFRTCDYNSIPDTTKEVETGDIGITFPDVLSKSAKSKTELYSYSKIYDIDNLYAAFLSASKGKRNKKAIYEFERNLGKNLIDLSNELKNKTYKPSAYRNFMIYEPKQRLIYAPTIKDSVVQHAIYMMIYDLFDKSFIHDSYGCRKDKGTHKASDKLQSFMRKNSSEDYYLQLDIRKYYYSIDRDILKQRIERKVKDKDLVNLIMMFAAQEKGLYVGNILSQLFGLIYLDRLDHFIKRVLKVKHYLRYVDDFVLVGFSLKEIYIFKNKIVEFLKENLKLELSKFRIAKIKKGCNFVGFRTWKSVKFVRKHTLHNFSKAIKKNKKESIISILGHAKYSSSYRYFINKLKGVNYAL